MISIRSDLKFFAIFIYWKKTLRFRHFYIKATIIIFIFVLCSAAQDSLTVYNLDEDIVVTASRIPTHFPSVARSVIVINQDQIKNSGAHTVEQLIETSTGIDFQQRGDQGVQADLNIRGATFEQSLILIDGVKMSDPQTGHHMMDIPLTINDIQRIEILKGQGSRLYGPNAFGGIINIITKNVNTTEVSILNLLGENKFYERNLSLLIPMFKGGHRFSIAQKASDGYRKNTDFDLKTASYGFHYKFRKHQLSLQSGLMDKQFGANSFYHPAFPNQWERTQTSTIKLSADGELFSLKYSNNIYHRYHTDEFMLNRDNPSFYYNRHYTNVYGLDLHLSKFSLIGNSSIGGEVIKETIESNNLGSHQRLKSGLFFEHQLLLNSVNLTLGSTLYHYSDQGWHIWPGLDVGYQITERSNLYGSIGYAFRAPTFTELYYNDPANRGNADLNVERGWNYELGYRYVNSNLNTNIAIFRREERNLIDWIWQSPDSIWQVLNISEINTNGFEIDANYMSIFKSSLLGINSIRMSYTYLNFERNLSGLISKYVINHLRHQAVWTMGFYLFLPTLKVNTKYRYEDRLHFGTRFLLDTHLSWQIGRYFNIHLDITNVFNHIYEDFHSVPLPGRWIKSGISFKINPANQ